jgi:hypothetical protein
MIDALLSPRRGAMTRAFWPPKAAFVPSRMALSIARTNALVVSG